MWYNLCYTAHERRSVAQEGRSQKYDDDDPQRRQIRT